VKPKILLIDDEESLIKWLSYALEQNGYSVFATTEPKIALNRLKEERFDCIISDIKMPEIDGFQFLRKVREIYPATPLIFITAYGTMESVVSALRDHASDYIMKPFGIDEILVRIKANLPSERTGPTKIVGESRAIQHILSMVEKIAATDTTVLILGESGTGKELIAREIHNRSKRIGNNFVSVSCAALPETLLESELFGYKKGAFTGANTDKEGLFKAADQGTFFLDEIGDAPAATQTKILRLLEEKEIVPLGSTKAVKVDVRLITATNKDLLSEVHKGMFREDLYYRINVIPITLPPLRQRKEDIPRLTEYFLQLFCDHENLGERKFLKTTIEALRNYPWPGNIRELKHVVERAALMAETFYIKPEDLGLRQDRGRKLQDVEDEAIKKALEESGGSIDLAAKRLGLSRATLYRKLRPKKKRQK
jgi:DNA-binding NtrC family response regulator